MSIFGTHPRPARTRAMAWAQLPGGCHVCRYHWRIGIETSRCRRCTRDIKTRRRNDNDREHVSTIFFLKQKRER